MQYVHGGNIYAEDSPTGEWLDFSANINPLGLPDSVRRAIIGNMDKIVHYPDPAAAKLKAAIAKHYAVPTEQIVLGNGATELFYLFFYVLGVRRAVSVVPSFAEYERAARAGKVRTEFLPFARNADGFSWPLDAMLSAMDGNTVLMLGNPNNPTGNLLDVAAQGEIVAAAQKNGAWLMIDESFLDFLGQQGRQFSFKPMVREYSRLMVVHSLTKFFALPGLRLGFAVAPVEVAVLLEAGKDVWNVNALAQAAGVAALDDAAYMEQSMQYIKEERNFLAQNLQKFSELRIFPSAVNFILVEIKQGITAAALTGQMRKRGVLIRDCGNYRALKGEYIRVAVRTHEENLRLVSALEGVLR